MRGTEDTSVSKTFRACLAEPTLQINERPAMPSGMAVSRVPGQSVSETPPSEGGLSEEEMPELRKVPAREGESQERPQRRQRS